MSLANLILNNQELFENVSKVISKDALATPFSTNSIGLPSGTILKEICFSYYNQSEIVLLDYDEPHDVEVIYKSNTTTTFSIDSNKLLINFSNPIFIDTSIGDYNLNWIKHLFEESLTSWNFNLDNSFLGNQVKKEVNRKIESLIYSIRKATDLDRKSFKPFLNLDKLMQTISTAIENFTNIDDPPNTPDEEKNKAPEVNLSLFSNLSFLVSFSLKKEFIYPEGEKNNFIKIKSLRDISTTLTIRRDLAHLINFYTNLAKVELQMEQIKITDIPIEVYYQKELILTISEVTLYFGGNVIVNKFKLFGLGASLEQTEVLIKTVLTTIVISQGMKKYQFSAYSPAIINSSNPKAKLLNTFIQTSLAEMIKETLTNILKKNIVIPGIYLDLKSFLGK